MTIQSAVKEISRRIKAKIHHLRLLRLMRSTIRKNQTSRRAVRGDAPVVVSLTSHGERIDRVHASIESIVAGSVRPSRLILWLNVDPTTAPLTPQLRDLQSRGLEILQCPNYGPHTKYYPYVASRTEHDCALVTADDDILYPKDWLRKLLDAHNHEPTLVHCYRARRMSFAQNGRLASYRDWGFDDSGLASFLNFGTGVSGVIYPPSMLTALAGSAEAFRQCCPKADDIWLHAIALRSGHRVKQLATRSVHFHVVPFTQELALYGSNLMGSGNDDQIAATYSEADLALLRAEQANA